MKEVLKKQYYIFLKLKNRILHGRPVLVLMYHRVSDVSDEKLAHLTVSLANFEKQLIYFKEKYQILTLKQEWSFLKRTGLVITFDDGYADNLMNALPLLEKHQIPATIFVTTLNTNTVNEFWWDRLGYDYSMINESFYFPGITEQVSKQHYSHKYSVSVISKLENDQKDQWFSEFESINAITYKGRSEYRSLTNEELKKLSDHPLIDIGLHTHNHYSLGNLTEDQQRSELSLSVQMLNQLTTSSIEYLALPHGSYNEDTLKITKGLGIKSVLLANNYYSNRHNKSAGKINRILMPDIGNQKLENYMKNFGF